MAHVLALDQIDDELGHVLGMVANALDGLGEEQQVQAGRDGAGVFHHVGDELAHKTVKFLVNQIVFFEDGNRSSGIEAGKRVQCLAQQQ